MNLKDAELMQYLNPVGLGPSWNRCPKCESADLDRNSIRTMLKAVSLWRTMFSCTSGRVKEGQPVPDLNLSFELNRGSPETIST